MQCDELKILHSLLSDTDNDNTDNMLFYRNSGLRYTKKSPLKYSLFFWRAISGEEHRGYAVDHGEIAM